MSGGDEPQLLQRAVAIAHRAHDGQTDKGGAPYIGHPLRVMRSVQGAHAKMVGVLHDVVEDSDVTLADLVQDGFPEPVVSAVRALTRRPDDDYEAYLTRLMDNPLALRVKIADMTDNMDLSRIPAPTAKDEARLDKYRRVLPRLQEALRKHEG